MIQDNFYATSYYTLLFVFSLQFSTSQTEVLTLLK